MNLLVLLLYRLFALISFIPHKISKYNTGINEKKANDIQSDYIENQYSYSYLHIGKKDISYCGCGVIATFNALIALNRKPSGQDLLNIIKSYEKRGLVFGGKLGISPNYVKLYFKNLGCSVKSIFTSNSIKLDEFGKMYDTFICTMYNSKKNISKGLHYICITKNKCGEFISHNPPDKAISLSALITKASADSGKSLYIIGVSNEKNNN